MLIGKYHVAIVGATVLIGREFVKILGQKDFSSASIHLFASDKSAGKKLFVDHREIELRELTPYSFDPIDIALFFAGSEMSQLDPEEA